MEKKPLIPPTPRKAASAPMDKAERAARAEAADIKMQKANTKAYDASLKYKNGGMVKMTPKSTPYMCGGKVK